MNSDTDFNKNLIAQGYTIDFPPEHAVWEYDGFTYTVEALQKMVFETPCGMLLKGSHCANGYMSYMGIDWRPENNNPVVHCPLENTGCNKNHPLLRDLRLSMCACHQTDRPYQYEYSIDKVWDVRHAMEERKFQAFAARKKGRVCRTHMRYLDQVDDWVLTYDPIECAQRGCTGFCQLRNIQLDDKRGNVFYDLQITRIRHDDSIFDGEHMVSVVKGKKFLNRSVSLSICKEIVKRCVNQIQQYETMQHHSELFFHPDMRIEVQNVRAERRESRDILQDLQDIRDGIAVVHASDAQKAAKEQKRLRREVAAERRHNRILKMAKQDGLDSLTPQQRRKLTDADLKEIADCKTYQQMRFY